MRYGLRSSHPLLSAWRANGVEYRRIASPGHPDRKHVFIARYRLTNVGAPNVVPEAIEMYSVRASGSSRGLEEFLGLAKGEHFARLAVVFARAASAHLD